MVDYQKFDGARTAFAKNERVLHWLSDDSRRAGFYAHLRDLTNHGMVFTFPAARRSGEQARGPRNDLADIGHAEVAILADPDHVRKALTSQNFSNCAYSEIGNGSFML